MTDTHPQLFEIEIDRERLKKYLRANWLLAWLGILVFFGVFIALLSIPQSLEHVRPTSGSQLMVFAVKRIVYGLACGLSAGTLGYLLLSHRLASRISDSIQVSVEGAFLRVRKSNGTQTDRKLHFRSLVDYSVVQSQLMRFCGIESLHITTIAGGQYPYVIIHGVKDCLRVRDLLADIDSLREKN